MSRSLTLRTAVLILADLIITYAGITLALLLRLGVSGTMFQLYEGNGFLKISVATLIYLIALYFYDLYNFSVINNRRELLIRMIQAIGSTWIVLAVIFYLIPTMEIGRGTSIYSLIITLMLLLAIRASIHYLMGHPEIGEKILVIGDGQNAIDTAQAILMRRDAGYRIGGFITEDDENIKTMMPGVESFAGSKDLEKIVHEKKIDRIVIAMRDRRGTFPTETLLRMSLSNKVNIEESSSFLERLTGKVHLNTLRPSWLIFNGRSRETRLKTFTREAVHRSLAVVGLLLSLPLAVLTAVLIKIESKGSIFYLQERVGKNGNVFKVIKFRSMQNNAEPDGKPVWATADDDRTTRVGRVIRVIRVDEIPQFWNIIKGDMNFVGPRPERPQFVEELAREIPFYEHRHLTAPGLTGWAQINYPYGASVEDAREKLEYDLYYIKNQSLILDIIIVFGTVKTVLFGRGGR